MADATDFMAREPPRAAPVPGERLDGGVATGILADDGDTSLRSVRALPSASVPAVAGVAGVVGGSGGRLLLLSARKRSRCKW